MSNKVLIFFCSSSRLDSNLGWWFTAGSIVTNEQPWILGDLGELSPFYKPLTILQDPPYVLKDLNKLCDLCGVYGWTSLLQPWAGYELGEGLELVGFERPPWLVPVISVVIVWGGQTPLDALSFFGHIYSWRRWSMGLQGFIEIFQIGWDISPTGKSKPVSEKIWRFGFEITL